jgi:Formin Homology 2 Domain
MDSNDQLPIDMVEQLLKFTPSAEERVLLDEHSEDIDSLARADRFLYEISKYVHTCIDCNYTLKLSNRVTAKILKTFTFTPI